jgi:anti-sigma-K factor RskA
MSDIGESGGSYDDDTIVAAEYVLGTLPAAEHAQFAGRLAADPALRRETRMWQNRLSQLDDGFAPVAAPASILPRLEQRLFGAPATPSWWDSLMVWRGLSGALAAVAVVAVGFSVMRPTPTDPQQFASQLVAALRQEGSSVSFVALYDQSSGTLRLTSLSGEAVPQKDFELWAIQGSEAPVSMGVIPVAQRVQMPVAADIAAEFGPGTVLAVTLEPQGGSPTGVATGPIVALGAATPI